MCGAFSCLKWTILFLDFWLDPFSLPESGCDSCLLDVPALHSYSSETVAYLLYIAHGKILCGYFSLNRITIESCHTGTERCLQTCSPCKFISIVGAYNTSKPLSLRLKLFFTVCCTSRCNSSRTLFISVTSCSSLAWLASRALNFWL